MPRTFDEEVEAGWPDDPDYIPHNFAGMPVVKSVERSSRFYSAAALKGKTVPPRQWLVHDLVPQKTVTLFSGDGGTGKSLLALQLAVAVAAQTAWIGNPRCNTECNPQCNPPPTPGQRGCDTYPLYPERCTRPWRLGARRFQSQEI